VSAADLRFSFGRNWRRFVESVDERHIAEAARGLANSLAVESMAGRSFLDIGCGSGIHSLAALRLGARSVFSFDFDEDSVAATNAIRARFGGNAEWRICRGSVLDPVFLRKHVPVSDVVYSWGVLHHTGAMWDAISAASARCEPASGVLLIGIYNEKRPATDVMRAVKRTYVASPRFIQAVIKWSYWGVTSGAQLLKGRNPLRDVHERISARGMDYWRDLEDWVGGYPYECASPKAVERFVGALGFALVRCSTRNTIAAVNEYLFRRSSASS
jgi:2-polyprenyl-6-hydroxyphenyl methylase/3-demethylubiquinone-9 3-methyltransferase